MGEIMKLVTSVIAISAASALLLSGCSAASTEKADKKDSESVQVEQGFFEVAITLPASMVQGQDFSAYEADMLSQGATSVTQNEDGSVTIKMPDAVHQVMMDKMKASLDESIDQTLTDQAGVINEIKYNDKVNEFTVTVDRAAFESSFGGGFVAMSLGLQSMFYQLFDGTSDAKSTINFVDAATGEVFDTVVYPDAMEASQ